MTDWLDGWARRAARSEGSQDNPASARGLSRRQLLKRAGVAAGAAWTVPLIQSAVAPAAAVSGSACAPYCPPGAGCGTDSDCAAGLKCMNGVCGKTSRQWTGSPCVANSNCWSGLCTGGVCLAGDVGVPCQSTADCATASCSSYTQTCGGSGASCTSTDQCVSGSCVGGLCG